ncbi:hypothetical protein F5Y00DRAFT_267554 [Daldinia vernicosa]|uniref:uncharacterized protein n=1 Tax=Daldinia vernicosa TaxID=114800 RepID=UPI002008D8F2|nr:uncharacterized protein F5Y00DRAFT_267554 [Daldinia vernicosa]KAI0854327.1 hypothetical protein F5Y00DRAFT_267554 [Daldinia vernicosa]
MASYSRQAYIAEDPGGVLRDIEVDEEAMMSPHRVDQGGIPLVCYACEKIPTFSDLSHLITHVSSKAHLLELYNLRIKSYGNEACAAQARKFEIWNQTYNIDQLVRQRMEARDEKGIQPQRRGNTHRDEAPGRSTARRGTRGTRGRRGNANSRGRSRKVSDLTDIKHEPDDGMSFGDGYEDLQGPSIHSWQTNLNPLMSQENDIDLATQGSFEDWGGEEDLVKYESSEAESSYPSENLTEVTEVNDADTGSLSLKGVVYPGMGLFDAAKEEQRRKRNQRKPPAVLLQLEINSTMVTTREDVYDLNLNYIQSRDVYDDPSIDGSECEDEDDVERKPRRRGAQTHATLVSKRGKQRTSSRDTRTTRTTRAAAQAAQRFTSTEDFIPPAHSRTLNAGGRIARSASNCGSVSQAQLPLHNHGFQGESSVIHDPLVLDHDLGWILSQEFAGDTPADIEQQMSPTPPLVDEGGSESLILSQFAYNGLTYIDSQDRLPGLALRPGNPNLSFASPSPSFKRSSSHFLGKENDGLARKPPVASSNPYLQSINSTHSENYNPLYVQPQDGLAFRMYDTYEEDVKPVTGFHPVNSHDGFNSLQMQAHHSATYAPNQTGADDFEI